MKNLITIIALIIGIGFTYSQNNLQATITGECADGSAVYTYVNTYNGKNRYEHIYTDGADTFTMNIVYYSGVWVLAEEGYYEDPSFYNTNIPAGVMPPLTGWVSVPDMCGSTGALTLSEVLASKTEIIKPIMVYPNPTNDYLVVNHKDNVTSKFNYTILDVSGRIVKQATTNFDEKIYLSTCQPGIYTLVIETDTEKEYQKIIKQ